LPGGAGRLTGRAGTGTCPAAAPPARPPGTAGRRSLHLSDLFTTEPTTRQQQQQQQQQQRAVVQ